MLHPMPIKSCDLTKSLATRQPRAGILHTSKSMWGVSILLQWNLLVISLSSAYMIRPKQLQTQNTSAKLHFQKWVKLGDLDTTLPHQLLCRRSLVLFQYSKTPFEQSWDAMTRKPSNKTLVPPTLDEDAAERKRVLNVLAQRRYSMLSCSLSSYSPTYILRKYRRKKEERSYASSWVPCEIPYGHSSSISGVFSKSRGHSKCCSTWDEWQSPGFDFESWVYIKPTFGLCRIPQEWRRWCSIFLAISRHPCFGIGPGWFRLPWHRSNSSSWRIRSRSLLGFL